MPTIRCSNEAYRLLQDKALQLGEPISIVLDRVIWGLDTLTPQQKPIAEPPVSPPAAAKAKKSDPAASSAAVPSKLQALIASLLQTPKE